MREHLEKLIAAGAGQGLPVAFDFDNTMVCGDIGEATLAYLTRNGTLRADRIPETLSPPVKGAHGEEVTIKSATDLTAYYEALLQPTAHGPKDPTPLATGYVWATEVMQGLTVADVAAATRRVFELSEPGTARVLEVTPGKTAYPVPFFWPELVELTAALLRHRFEVWIVSASNVWSVRWLICHALNPLIRRQYPQGGIRPERVIGLSTLLADQAGRLYKDPVLVREDPAYATMKEGRLQALRLTSRLVFPASIYSGKVAALWDATARPPYLAVGDSPGDLPMLSFSQNRLWMARLEKPAYQRPALALVRRAKHGTWLIQPTLCQPKPGLVPRLRTLQGAIPARSQNVAASVRALSPHCP